MQSIPIAGGETERTPGRVGADKVFGEYRPSSTGYQRCSAISNSPCTERTPMMTVLRGRMSSGRIR